MIESPTENFSDHGNDERNGFCRILKQKAKALSLFLL